MPRLQILSRLVFGSSLKRAFYFHTRKLSRAEILFVRSSGLERLSLRPLSSDEQQRFFREFDLFWCQVIKGRGPQEACWRNGVFSKMQEWENSAGYLALTLFTLSLHPPVDGTDLIVLPGSIQEADLWCDWAAAQGWPVVTNTFSLGERVVQEVENVLRALRLSGLALLKKWQVRSVGFRGQACPDGSVLLLSMFYRRALLAEVYEDQFFGHIRDEFRKNGRECVTLGDALDGLRPGDGVRLGTEGRPVSIYSVVSWPGLIVGIGAVLFRALRFRECSFNGCDFSALLSWQARSFRYDFNLTAEFFYWAILRLASQRRFCKMLYGYEGNVYERAAIQAFRRSCKAPVDAYSHGVLFPLNLKLYSCSAESGTAPEPDRYLVCGHHVREIFARMSNTLRPVLPVCTLRNIPQVGQKASVEVAEVLIVLDGVWSAATMLDWLYVRADIFEGRSVAVRPHPNVRGERLFGQCPHYRAGLFRVSERPLADDLKDAFCVIYRQSSVGIQALMNGIPIIYLNVDQPLGGDPLDQAGPGWMVVEDADALRMALARVPDARRDLSLMGDASKIAERYFAAPSAALLRPFLEVSTTISRGDAHSR